MNPISSTIIEGVRIYYPTSAEPMPAPDPQMPSFTIRPAGGWYWLYAYRNGGWHLAYNQPLATPSAVIIAAVRYHYC
ncbi:MULTISPECIES: hypothetical protein [unclassified Serratia (in: enterobacteria)]|uniref:hypothetical protein n=1 Tax=unclassified Serratia (in: enterobacteria) TaxID=2647522 RepID=UPI000A69D3FE|nr:MULTISPECIES: hypothetical protein [unclassified Serratia (in: enterobacteria)]